MNSNSKLMSDTHKCGPNKSLMSKTEKAHFDGWNKEETRKKDIYVEISERKREICIAYKQ